MNGDFSYNTNARRIFNRPRTTHDTVGESISHFFTNWYDFYYDEQFDLVRNMYFSANNRKSIFAEDIFEIRDVGYHGRHFGGAVFFRTEIRADTVFQVHRLAHIDDLAGGIEHAVHARCIRQQLQFFADGIIHFVIIARCGTFGEVVPHQVWKYVTVILIG